MKLPGILRHISTNLVKKFEPKKDGVLRKSALNIFGKNGVISLILNFLKGKCVSMTSRIFVRLPIF